MRHLLVAAVVWTCAICVGCGDTGPELGTVDGQVTMDGKPLPDAVVTFMPVEGGGASTAKTDTSGQYSLGYLDRHGALIGKHRVAVATLPPEEAAPPEITSDDPAYEKQTRGAADYNKAVVREKIPARYNSQSEMVHEVKPGKNVINLELKSS